MSEVTLSFYFTRLEVFSSYAPLYHVDVLRDQIAKYREKFEVSMQQVADIDTQMKKYLDTQMQDPGPMQQNNGKIF